MVVSNHTLIYLACPWSPDNDGYAYGYLFQNMAYYNIKYLDHLKLMLNYVQKQYWNNGTYWTKPVCCVPQPVYLFDWSKWIINIKYYYIIKWTYLHTK